MLTDAFVLETTLPGYHPDHSAGLYLIVHPTKAGGVTKSWAVRYDAPDGRRREFGLGRFPEFSLTDAREKARAARKLAKDGTDPIEQRKQERRADERVEVQAITFEQCAEAFLKVNGPTWTSDKHRKQWASTLRTYAFPQLGSKQVNSITTAMIADVLEPIWNSKRETARRLRERLEQILTWATTKNYRDGDHNPAARSNLALPKRRAKPVQHHSALPFAEMPAFMSKLRGMDGAGARALEFTILCASRTGETLGARWTEFDMKRALWTVPASRMKSKREHRVALSKQTLQLLNDIRATQSGLRLAAGTARPGGSLTFAALERLKPFQEMLSVSMA